MRLDATVLSDLSANVFAALLLVLLILLQAAGEEGATAPENSPAGSVSPVEATEALRGQWRTPMRAGDVVAFLYDRRPEAEGLSLDLGPNGARSKLEGATAEPDLDARLRGADPATPVRLYVFANEGYDAVRDALGRAGLPWREISVPRALRDPSGGWSADFRALLARRLDLPRFREGLARLLAAGPGPRTRDDRTGRSGGSGAASSFEASHAASPAGASLLDRVLRGLGLALAIGSVLAGFAAVAIVERVVPAARPRYPGAQRPDGDASEPHGGHAG